MRVSLAIEIGEKYLKIAAAIRRGMQSKLIDCIVKPIASFSDDNVTVTINDILRKNKYTAGLVTISLPRNFVTVRSLHLPSQEPTEISKMIELHVGRIIPYKREEVFLGYHSCGLDDLGYTKEILAIARSEIVKRQMNILDKAGLLVDRITLSSYGVLQRMLGDKRLQINKTDIYLALDINTAFTDFIIFSKENLLFSRSIAVNAGGVNSGLEMKKFLGEVKQALLVFYNEEVNKKPEKIFLTGAFNEHTGRILEQELDIKVHSAGPAFSAQELKPKEGVIPFDTAVTAICELALEDKDHIPSFIIPEMQIRKALREKTKNLTILGGLIIYFFALSCFTFLGRNYNQQVYLEKITRRALEVNKDVGGLVKQIDGIVFVKESLIVRRAPLFAIYQLQKVIPDNIAVNFISVDKNEVTVLRGRAHQASDIYALRSKLEQIKHFKNVEGPKYTRKRKLRGEEVVDFEFSFTLDTN